MDEAELQRDLGPDDATAQHPVECACQANEPCHALCSAGSGDDAGAHFRVSVAEVAGLADPQVAGEGELEPASHGVSVHRGDDDLGQRHHLVEDRLVTAYERPGVSGQGGVARQPVQLLDAVLGEEAVLLRTRLDYDRSD